ncbi:Cys-tRNA(Pro) deacylase [Enterococcus gallinarum]|uniref:Cys-tRNA(Pro) deacylase n=1 Tax=Enterococcus gallinarum TaxID=1353 RepID=UPI002DB654ED|nr:Cys-tRNA(Pro) deacylase [Enterococcus gallinarum]MEB6064109.1 Cys-tRNA(Pro) deacylase [Enterococcus gallinarum]
MAKVKKTNAIRMVEQKKISYQEYTYEWSEDHLDAGSVAQQIAHPEAIYKTLVAVGNKTGPIVAVIPGDHELDLKKIAKASGNKKVEMLHLRDLEETTGYIRGGCSPIGMKKLFPTYIDESARHLEEIIISAGKRGLQIGLSPTDLSKLVRGQFVSLTAISEVD